MWVSLNVCWEAGTFIHFPRAPVLFLLAVKQLQSFANTFLLCYRP